MCAGRLTPEHPFRYHQPQSISFYKVGQRPGEGKGHAGSTGELGGSSHCNTGQWKPKPQIALLDQGELTASGEEGAWMGRKGGQFRAGRRSSMNNRQTRTAQQPSCSVPSLCLLSHMYPLENGPRYPSQGQHVTSLSQRSVAHVISSRRSPTP